MKPLLPGQARAFQYVEQIARHGSIRRAADVLGVASSAVNRMVREYETVLGIALFERLPRGVRLTSAGELLIDHIRRTSRDFEKVRRQIENIQGLERGHVTIATIEATASTLLAAQIARFHQAHQMVTFHVQVLGSPGVVNAVLADRCELGLALNPPKTQRFRTLASVHYVLHAFVVSSHPLASRQRIQLSDCLGFPVALGDHSLGGRRLLDEALAEAEITLSNFLTTNSVELMQSVVERTDGICFQVMALGGTWTNKSLKAIPVFDRKLPEVELALGANHLRSLSIAASAFANDLCSTLGKQ